MHLLVSLILFVGVGWFMIDAIGFWWLLGGLIVMGMLDYVGGSK